MKTSISPISNFRTQVAPRVYVVHAPLRHDRATGRWVARVDLSPAEEFGALVHLLPPQSGGNDRVDLPALAAELAAGLGDLTADDYLLPVGHPALIAAAAAYAARRTGGLLRLLEWNRDPVGLDAGYYRPVELRLWDDREGR